MDRIDAHTHLTRLVGRTIRTLTGRPNHVIALEGLDVVVGTERSPSGSRVPLKWVQDALDRLAETGEVEISVQSVGYRSAFIGAVLLTVPGAEAAENPRRVLLRIAKERRPAPRIEIIVDLSPHEEEGEVERIPLPEDVPPEDLLDFLTARYGDPLTLPQNEAGVPIGYLFDGRDERDESEVIAIPVLRTGDNERHLYEVVQERRDQIQGATAISADPIASIPLPNELWAQALPTVTDWSDFQERLAGGLEILPENTFLILTKRGTNRFVQFAQGGRKGFRAEAVSGAFLKDLDQLPEEAEDDLIDLGWIPPDSDPDEPRGNVNFYRVWPGPGPFAEVAALAVTTMKDVFEMQSPAELEYQAFGEEGPFFMAPLGLPLHVERESELGPDLLDGEPTLEELDSLVERTLTTLIGRSDIDKDKDGDIPIRWGSALIFVRVQEGNPPWVYLFAPLLWDVAETPSLLDAINEMNKKLAFGRAFWTGEEVRIGYDLTSLYLSSDALAHACHQVGAAADHFDGLLQERFGGSVMFGEPQEPKTGEAPGYL
jgi:hypothetical protein